MFRNRLLIIFLTFLAILVLAIGALDAFLRSYDEASDEDRARGVRTKIGDYRSFRPIGTLPLPLILALKKWPDRAACLFDPDGNILRWEEMGSPTEIEVCLSRMFANAATDEEIVAILNDNGFWGARVMPAIGRFNSSKTIVIGTCDRASRPCGYAMENFWSIPFEAYAFSINISRDGHTTLDINVGKSIK
jgi:hypothetical protein